MLAEYVWTAWDVLAFILLVNVACLLHWGFNSLGEWLSKRWDNKES